MLSLHIGNLKFISKQHKLLRANSRFLGAKRRLSFNAVAHQTNHPLIAHCSIKTKANGDYIGKMRPQIVLFGDSITEQSFRSGGWGASLSDTYSRKADVLVRGYGGYNTRWALFLLNHIFPLDAAKAPAAVTVFFGANDAALIGRTGERQHVPVEEYKENLRKIVHHLKKCSPTVLVVLITPPPIDEEGRLAYARSLYGDEATKLPERTNEMAGVYAKQCVELAKEQGIRSIDLWSKMQETEGWQKKFLSDGLHLTPEGNAVVSQQVVAVFREAWLSAEAMPYDFPHHSQIDGLNPEKAFQQLCL